MLRDRRDVTSRSAAADEEVAGDVVHREAQLDAVRTLEPAVVVEGHTDSCVRHGRVEAIRRPRDGVGEATLVVPSADGVRDADRGQAPCERAAQPIRRTRDPDSLPVDLAHALASTPVLRRLGIDASARTCQGAARMCCLALVTVGLGPRIALALWWIFGDRVDLAFGSWIVPLLGLLFLPWTTLMYVIVWSPIGGVEGAEWLLVALGLVLDIATYSARAARGKTSYY